MKGGRFMGLRRLCQISLLALGFVTSAQAGPKLDTSDPLGFFTNLASRLLQSELNLNLTRIQVYPTNQYTPAVHRLLQVTANILDATNASYSFAGANLASHHGNFSVVATDDISTTISSNAFIYVLVRPGIVQHITSQTVLQGGTAVFSLVATGAPPLWYRWIRNLGSLPGATTSVPVLVITNVQASGMIRVAVTNAALPSGVFSPGPSPVHNVQLIMLADVDGDGMWDDWETNYFGTNLALTLPGADPDGDGMSNLDEYRSGTIPTNTQSVLKIVLTATNANVLEFVAQTNLSYSVQSRSNLNSPAWINVTSLSASPLVRTVQVNAATAPPGTERYLRIVTPSQP